MLTRNTFPGIKPILCISLRVHRAVCCSCNCKLCRSVKSMMTCLLRRLLRTFVSLTFFPCFHIHPQGAVQLLQDRTRLT